MDAWMQGGAPRDARLSELIDWAAGEGGRRDELFVRTLAQFLDQHRERIRIETVQSLSLTDVVVTFKMKGSVTLIATGYSATQPGEFTWRVEESDFPVVRVSVGDELEGEPYDFCTLDYSWQGRRGVLVRPFVTSAQTLEVGTPISVIVYSTLGADEHVRARVEDGGAVVNLPVDAFRLL